MWWDLKYKPESKLLHVLLQDLHSSTCTWQHFDLGGAQSLELLKWIVFCVSGCKKLSFSSMTWLSWAPEMSLVELI